MPDGAGSLSWSVPADYRPVHDLYRELRVGPYAYLRDMTPEGLVRRFWPWLLGLLSLAAWIIHAVRVEYLVHRRTAELRESLHAREMAETRMRENQEQMEHLSRLSVLGELSGNLAHEINQPLTTIGTYARSVLRRQGSGKLTPEALTKPATRSPTKPSAPAASCSASAISPASAPAVREPVDLAAIAAEARRLIVGMLAQAPEIAIDDRSATVPGARRRPADPAGAAQPDQERHRFQPRPAGRTAEHTRPASKRGQAPAGPCHRPWRRLDAAQRARLFEPFFTTKPDGLGLGPADLQDHHRSPWRPAVGRAQCRRSACAFPFPSPAMNYQPDQCVVHVVDDDPALRRSLRFLLESVDWQVQLHASAEEFLERSPPPTSPPACCWTSACRP